MSEAASKLSDELLLALADVAHPAVKVDQRPDLLVADGGNRDHVAAVGVADEHDRTGQGLQDGQVGGVTGQVAKRVAEPDDGVPAVLRARISASKPVASAQAPWTKTIVGVSAMLTTSISGTQPSSETVGGAAVSIRRRPEGLRVFAR